MCSLLGRLPGVCGAASRPHLQLLCPSLCLPTPAPKHLPSTPTTHTRHGVHRTFCTNYHSSSSLSEFGVAKRVREGRGVWGKRGCVWGVKGVRGISVTAPRHMFWEKDVKGGYGKEVEYLSLFLFIYFYYGGLTPLICWLACYPFGTSEIHCLYS